MEKLGVNDLNLNPHFIAPESTNIETTSDLKASTVGKSILKKLGVELSQNKKNISFDNVVTHKQTHGKVIENDDYQVKVTITKLPLVDEDENIEERIWTKRDLIEIENAIKEEKILVAKGEILDEREAGALKRAEEMMSRLESLFDGRRNLPFHLDKPSPRSFDRSNVTQSAGYMTNTTKKSTIIDPNIKTASWPRDKEKEKTLQELHDTALAKFSGGTTTVKLLCEKMLDLRTFDRQVMLTKEELFDLYLDFDKKKEKFLSTEVIQQIEGTKDLSEKTRLLKAFYYENLLPMESDTEVDMDAVKEFLEEHLDLSFEEDSLKANFSSTTDNDIMKFLIEKYNKKI